MLSRSGTYRSRLLPGVIEAVALSKEAISHANALPISGVAHALCLFRETLMTSAIVTVRTLFGSSPKYIRVARARDMTVLPAFQREILLYHPRDVEPRGFYAVGRLTDFCPDPEDPKFMFLAVNSIRTLPRPISARQYLKATGQTVDQSWWFRQFSPGFRIIPRQHILLVEALATQPGDFTEAMSASFGTADVTDEFESWPAGLPLTASKIQLETRRKRDAQLRFDTLDAYGPRCAASNISILAPDGIGSEVEVCHLWSFADGGPDTVNNAMPMMRSVHWCFDKGWFGIRQNGNLSIAPYAPNFLQTLLKDRRSANFPERVALWPRPEFLRWHWDNRYRRILEQLGAADRTFA